MKRFNNLHEKVCELSNVWYADELARKNKKKRWGIIKHDQNRERENLKLSEDLFNLTYSTSDYTTYKIYEPKERIIYRLPYYPDRICHHSIMNVLEPIWTKTFIDQTYSCIKNRGIHKLANDVKKVLKKDVNGTKYCLKLDIKKFYPSINHDILLEIVKRKIKDKKLLTLLSEIIYSTDGVPIGNYLSQYFANLYLSYFDHWLKEEVKVKYYFRYADDIVILSDSKEHLRKVLILIKIYLKHILNLEIKSNYQVFPVDSRGIDFVGYVFYHTHVLLRKSIKTKMFNLIQKYKSKKISRDELIIRMQSYFGWLKHCNSKHLLQKIEEETHIHFSNWNGKECKRKFLYNKYVYLVKLVPYKNYFELHFVYKNIPYFLKSEDWGLYMWIFKNYKTPCKFIWKK